jgi:hypothetical protein
MKASSGDVEGAIAPLRRCYDAAPGLGSYSAALEAAIPSSPLPGIVSGLV